MNIVLARSTNYGHIIRGIPFLPSFHGGGEGGGLPIGVNE